MRKISYILVLLLAFSFVGCAKKNALWSKKSKEELQALDEEARPKTQLEVRQIQTHSFSDSEPNLVMKALLDVLQDDGFVVKNAVMELGLLSATKEIDVSDSSQAFVNSLLFGIHARWNKNSIIEATSNVSKSGKDSKVRVTFQIKTLNNRGEVSDVKEINEAKYYQDFFAKVDKGLFVQKQGL